MMDENEVYKKVAEMTSVRFNISKAQVSRHLNFTNDLGADFIDLAQFVTEIEDEFVDIPKEQAANIQDVGNLVSAIIRNSRKPHHKKIIIKKKRK